GKQATVAGGGRGAGLTGAARQGDLGVVRQGTVTHAGDHDRDFQLNGLLGVACAEDRLRRATLAIPFERNASQPAGDKSKVIEGGPGAGSERAEAADAITPQLGLDLDVLDDGGRVGTTRLRGVRRVGGRDGGSVWGGHEVTLRRR